MPRPSKYRPIAFTRSKTKISREDLRHPWRLVRANLGSPGIDGFSFEAIDRGIGIDTFLRELARDLKDKT